MNNKFLIYSLLIFGLIVSACSSTKPESKSPTASASAQRYEVKGKVVSVNKAEHKVDIAHEEIKGSSIRGARGLKTPSSPTPIRTRSSEPKTPG